MKAIVAVDKQWGIGRNGALLVRIPADMKRFRALTEGGTVILGRKTLETFPKGAPLEGRNNIILSKNPAFTAKGAQVVQGIEGLKTLLDAGASAPVWVIGGEQIYRQLLPECDECEVTFIDHIYDADARFPNLDEDPAWEMVAESEEQVYFDLTYTYRTYRKCDIL